MLEPWIIEQIRRREEEERRQNERPQLEMPVHEPRWPTRNDAETPEDEPDEEEPKRGVVIIGF